ncbi:MAG: 4Fe-4S binding protein [Neobacillus sp.]
MSVIVNWLESLHEQMKISSTCSRGRNRKSTCTHCADQCSNHAITITDQLPIIDADLCSMCGDCMIACPLSAIVGLAVYRKFEKASLVFDDTYTPTTKELLIYAKRGLQSIQINQQSLNQEWTRTLNEANTILSSLNQLPITVVRKIPNEKLSRRAFFQSFQKEGKQLAKNMAPAAWKIESDGWKLSKYYPQYQFYTVEIDQNKCTICRACFSVCSEKVFVFEDGSLEIQNNKCVNCTACTDVCSQDAIKIIPDIKSKCETTKAYLTKQCKNCGQKFYTFHSNTETCYICVDREHDWLSP